MAENRLPFEINDRLEEGAITGHAGNPVLIEAFRATGTAPMSEPLAAHKRVGLPEDLRTARPKHPRFLVLNTVGKVVRHAGETLLRYSRALAGTLCDQPRTQFSRLRPALLGI